MKEIKVYARAGQGAITTAVILGSAYFKEGRYAYAFPHFGAARMGAPMNAFIRISENPIRVRCRVYEPDYVLVIDPTLMKMENVFEGIKEGGIVLVNTTEEKIPSPDGVKIYTLPGNDIAMEVMGRPLANTVLLGAYAAVTKEIKIESLKEAIKVRFKGEAGEKHALCAERGFEYMSSKL
jgi:pyruvate ferredoxin oxidoreductase gamma subunit